MNIVSSTKLRSNLASTLKRLDKEKYLLISQRGKTRLALVDFEFLKKMLRGVDDSKLEELERLEKEYAEVYK